MFQYVILGVCIGYFSRFLLVVIKNKIEERREDRNDDVRFS